MNIETMAYEELKSTRDRIDQLMQERREAAMEELRTKAAVMGLDMQSIFSKMNGTKGKYRGPQGQEWGGKGRKPAWLQEALDRGQQLEEFALR
jgi:DNA-binding protein H-NS